MVADIDTAVVGIADKVGPVTLARLLDEAMLRLHAEEREIEQLEDLDARYVLFEKDRPVAMGGVFRPAHDVWATI